MGQANPREATAHARKAVELRPDDAEGISLLGLCLTEEETTRESGFEYLRQAVLNEPDEPRWQMHLGQGLRNAGRYIDAEKAFASAAKLSGDEPGFLMRWGKALRLAGRPAEASQIYARVIARSPSSAAWRAASEALTEAGDLSTAAIAYEKAYPPENRSEAATAHLADIHIALENFDKAQAFNEQLLSLNPDDADAGLRAAKLLRASGNIDGAKNKLADLWTKNPNHGGIAAALLRAGEAGPRALAETIAQDESKENDERRRCAFALCDFTDKLGESDAAWRWAVLANSLYSHSGNTLSALRIQLDKAIDAYHSMPNQPAETHDTRAAKLVYILGVPKSGGELLQSVLARHPNVRSVGKRGALLKVLSPLLNVSEELAAQTEKLSKADLASVTRDAGMADYYIDNTLHYFLVAGLLEKIHPGAKLIAPHRDIKDLAVSLFFHDFGAELAFTRDLPAIQEYLDFYDAALVRWRDAGVKIVSHNHNRFAADMAVSGRALCDMLGLNWQSDMADVQSASPYKNRGERYSAQLEAAGFID